jgi:hypothetical protein
MADETAPAHDQVIPGHFHRLAIASRPEDGTGAWLRAILGAAPVTTPTRQVHGIPMSGSREGRTTDSGATGEVYWLGSIPVTVLNSTDEESALGRYVARHGPGLHSVAWTVRDLWGTQTLLARQGVRITGSDLLGRHFFMHPADSAGLLTEWTDTEFEEDPRDGRSPMPSGTGLIAVQAVNWITLISSDGRAASARFSELARCRAIAGLPRRAGYDTVDLRVGDVVIRFASPREGPAAISPRLESFCLAVNDIDECRELLQREGIAVIADDGISLWTAPADTAGLRLEWSELGALADGDGTDL